MIEKYGSKPMVQAVTIMNSSDRREVAHVCKFREEISAERFSMWVKDQDYFGFDPQGYEGSVFPAWIDLPTRQIAWEPKRFIGGDYPARKLWAWVRYASCD